MKMQLLVEDARDFICNVEPELMVPHSAIQVEPEQLAEGVSTSKKNLYLKGIFMQADIKNRNGRIYPLSEMSRSVSNALKIIKENGGIFGELDHPNSLQINSDRISHVIKELYMDGPNVIGKAMIIEKTPMGKILEAITETGVRVGVSSRGTGQVSESGVVSSYNLITVDAVIVPSAPAAMPLSVYESLEMNKNGKQVLTLSEALLEDKAAQKYFNKQIKLFVQSILNK